MVAVIYDASCIVDDIQQWHARVGCKKPLSLIRHLPLINWVCMHGCVGSPSRRKRLVDKRSRQLLRANPLDPEIWDLNASNGQKWVLTAHAWDQQMYTDARQALLSPQASAGCCVPALDTVAVQQCRCPLSGQGKQVMLLISCDYVLILSCLWRVWK